MRYASICSGIEAASVAFKPLGWHCEFVAEIEPFPCKVLKHHYPETPNYGDITKYQEWPMHSIDVLIGGTPCQSFSVAGLRAGLRDPRGNLTLTFLGIVERYGPRHVVWENVPGIFSDKTKALHSFLNGLEQLGYLITGFDVLDAQWFGLAQRRRRIFVCATKVEDLLNRRTSFSRLIVTQCLAEIWQKTLGVLCGRFSLDHACFNCESSKAELSLKKRIELFALQKDGQVSRLLKCLAGTPPSSDNEHEGSESNHGKNSHQSRTSRDTRSSATEKSEDTKMESRNTRESQNIGKSWNSILEDGLKIASESITSTARNETIDLRIFTCATALLTISESMLDLSPSLPNFSNAAASCLIALKEFTNYARLTGTDLFGGMDGVRGWIDFIAEAESASNALGNIGVECFGETLPLAESLRRDSAPRREKRERTPADAPGGFGSGGHEIGPTLSARTRGGNGLGTDAECDGGVIPIQEIAPTIRSGASNGGPGHGARSGDSKDELIVPVAFQNTGQGYWGESEQAQSLRASKGAGAHESNVVAHTLKAEGHDASEDGTGRGVPLVPEVAWALQERDSKGSDSSAKDGHLIPISFSSKDSGGDCQEDLAPTLRSGNEMNGNANGGIAPAVAFQQNQLGEVRTGEVAGTLNQNSNASGRNTPMVKSQTAVRRLTPEECEALQGFPRGYTKIDDKTADGPRYRALGNSFAVQVVAWIGRRIELVDQLSDKE